MPHGAISQTIIVLHLGWDSENYSSVWKLEGKKEEAWGLYCMGLGSVNTGNGCTFLKERLLRKFSATVTKAFVMKMSNGHSRRTLTILSFWLQEHSVPETDSASAVWQNTSPLLGSFEGANLYSLPTCLFPAQRLTPSDASTKQIWFLPSSGLLSGARWLKPDVSGLPVSPIFKGQRWTAWPFKMGAKVVPKHRF